MVGVLSSKPNRKLAGKSAGLDAPHRHLDRASAGAVDSGGSREYPSVRAETAAAGMIPAEPG